MFATSYSLNTICVNVVSPKAPKFCFPCVDIDDDIPTFSPAECTGEDAFFAMCVNVGFVDASNDIMLLKQSSDEPTIFEGRLKNEKAKVVLIRPDDDDTLTVGFRFHFFLLAA